MRLAPLIIILFLFLIAALLYSLFFSESGISERNLIIERNKELLEENQKLIDESNKLSESIKQAQENPNMHIENIAREKFNLTMPDEEFIVFEEEDENE
jgi:cell division protein FtsB